MAEKKEKTNAKPFSLYDKSALKKPNKNAFINRKLIALNKKGDAISKANAVRVTQLNNEMGGTK